MGSRGFAGDGKSGTALARSSFRIAAVGLRRRVPAGGLLLLYGVPTLGLAPDVLRRRAACPARAVLRYRVKESAVWEKSRQSTWNGLGSAILCHRKLFLCLTAYMTAMHLVSHGTQDLYPTFLKEQRGFSTRQVAVIAVAYNICAVAGCVFFGFLSDRIGRRRGIIAAFFGGMLVVPLWAYAPSTGLLVFGACLLMFLVQGAFGVIPAHINELSPDSVRGFLPGFAYACGVIPAGYIAYVEALFAEHFGYSTAMAVTAVTVFALGIVANLPG